MTTVQGKFIADFVKRVLETFFQIFDSRNISTVPASLFLDEYRIMHGPYTFVDLDYISRELSDIVICRVEDGQKLLELTSLYRLGSEIVMVLRESGGVVLLCELQSKYSLRFQKNLQPVRYGYSSLEILLQDLHLFVKVISQNKKGPKGTKSVIMKSLYDQHCLMRQGRVRSDSGSGYGSGTPPISRSLFHDFQQSQLKTQQASKGLRNTPDIIGHIVQEPRAIVSQGVRSVQQEQMLSASIRMSPKEKMRMTPTLSCNLTRTRKESIRSNSTSSKEESDSMEHTPPLAYSTGNKDNIITLNESDDEDENDPNPPSSAAPLANNPLALVIQHLTNSPSNAAALPDNKLASVEQHQVYLANRRKQKNRRMAAFFPDAN
jgi:hypothetical protein